MKKKIILFIAAVVGMFAATSCSSDDNGGDIVDASFLNQTLEIKYNGTPVIGKNAHLHFDRSQDCVGRLTLYSAMDLGGVASDNMGENLIYGPGVLPGTPTVTIPVNIVKNGDNYDFQYSGSTEYVNFSLTGAIRGDVLSLDFTNVTLRNSALAGKKFRPRDPDYENEDDPEACVYVNWISSKNLLIEDTEVTVGFFIKNLVLNAPFIEFSFGASAEKTQMSVYDIVYGLLKNVTFMADGNIAGSYVDMNTGVATAVPLGIAQYVVDGPNSIRLYLNPEMIIASAMEGLSGSADKTPEIDTTPLLLYAMQELVPMLSQGIPVQFSTDGAYTNFYLPSSILVPFVKGPLYDLTKDPNFMPFVQDMLKDQDPSIQDFVAPILTDLPAVLEATTTLEIGLTLVAAQ